MHFLKINRIRVRITLYFSLLIFLIVIAISTSISYIFSQEVIKQTSSTVQQKMSVITRELDEKLGNIKSISSDVINNNEIQRIMSTTTLYGEETDNKIRKISNALSSYYNGNYLVNKIIFIGMNNQVLDLLYSFPLYSNAITNNEYFKEFVKGNYFGKFSVPTAFPMNTSSTDESDKLIITYYAQYLSNKDYETLGYMLINLNKELLFNSLKSVSSDVFDTTYIVNSNGKLIYRIGTMQYERDSLFANTSGRASFKEVSVMKGTKYLIYSNNLSNNPDWFVVGIVSYDKLTQKLWYMNTIIYLIGAACILLVVFISFYIAKNITNPIFLMNKAMRKVEMGEWPETIKTKSEDELEYLITGFNKMVQNIKNLIDRIYEEQENKKKAEVSALKFQLESLQSQINPHFMYNTLNAISYLAMKRGADDIREVIQSFNMLLSASMSTKKEFITINEEIDCILSYLKIQRCRYDIDFKFIVEIPDDVRELKIPRLILQPLVENSLLHGIALKELSGTIKVEFEKENDCVRISVIDDGVGISRNNVPIIANSSPYRDKRGFNSIGLANVDERLKLYFGEEYHLEIFSSIGIGTCVRFKIPIELQ
jgi:two-component system, sensor histidine kinase YesM